MKLQVRKGDLVLVLSGKDKGRRGRILQALPQDGKIIVEGINIVKRHMRPTRATRTAQPGIIEMPAPMYACKVMLICPRCDKPTKIRRAILDNRRVRFCRRCRQPIDAK